MLDTEVWNMSSPATHALASQSTCRHAVHTPGRARRGQAGRRRPRRGLRRRRRPGARRASTRRSTWPRGASARRPPPSGAAAGRRRRPRGPAPARPRRLNDRSASRLLPSSTSCLPHAAEVVSMEPDESSVMTEVSDIQYRHAPGKAATPTLLTRPCSPARTAVAVPQPPRRRRARWRRRALWAGRLRVRRGGRGRMGGRP